MMALPASLPTSASPPRLTLNVDGQAFVGWVEATVERGCDAFAHSCNLRYLDQWSTKMESWKIRGGAECTLTWRDKTLITGYVDRPAFQLRGDQFELQAAFRSRTGDVVDASAVHETGSWQKQTAGKIVGDLLKPYGLNVTVDGEDTPFPTFALREGETVFQAIDRVCKVRALLPITTATGDVRLYSTSGGGAAGALGGALAGVGLGKVRGFPVGDAISRSYVDDTTMRHSEYLTRSTGITDEVDALARGAAQDTGVARFRPLVVIGDAPAGTVEAELRAIWEANIRYGKGERLIYEILGVETPDGDVYEHATRWNVQDTFFGVDLEMVLAKSTIESHANTLFTRLEFTRPEAYSKEQLGSKASRKIVQKTKQKLRTKAGL